jgi:hypothetical protein
MFFYGQTQNNNINVKFWSINVKKYTMNNDIQWLKKNLYWLTDQTAMGTCWSFLPDDVADDVIVKR